jgi:hypothetical protein
MSGIDGKAEQATFTLVVNDEHVDLGQEDRDRIYKAIQEVASSKLRGQGEGYGHVSFTTWDRVASEVIDAHTKYQISAISAVASDMAHRS